MKSGVVVKCTRETAKIPSRVVVGVQAGQPSAGSVHEAHPSHHHIHQYELLVGDERSRGDQVPASKIPFVK